MLVQVRENNNNNNRISGHIEMKGPNSSGVNGGSKSFAYLRSGLELTSRKCKLLQNWIFWGMSSIAAEGGEGERRGEEGERER